MSYKLQFLPQALKQYGKLGSTVRLAFKKQLIRRLDNPKIEKYRLHGDKKGHYKIKLNGHGYRLIYKVLDDKLVVLVVEIDRRDKIYKNKN